MAKQLFLDDMIDDNMDGTNRYTEYFLDSIGKGNGKYYSGIGNVYKASTRYQKGYGYLGQMYKPPTFRHGGSGLGSALMSMFRFAMPMLKRGVQKFGTEAVDVASKIATDVIQGKNIAESAKQHASEKVGEVLKQVPGAIAEMVNKTPETVIQSSVPSQPLKRRRVLGSKFRPRSVGGKRQKHYKKYPALAFM
jgi:hypothetical protein